MKKLGYTRFSLNKDQDYESIETMCYYVYWKKINIFIIERIFSFARILKNRIFSC